MLYLLKQKGANPTQYFNLLYITLLIFIQKATLMSSRDYNNIWFLIAIMIMIPGLVFSQQKTYPSYKVVSLPQKLNYNKESLNAELSVARSKDEARKIIDRKKFSQARIVFKISKSQNEYTWWTINTATKVEKEDEHIILQSRNSGTSKMYKLSDFKTLFKDTLVLLDTLTTYLFIHDPAYPDDRYQASITCDGSTWLLNIPFVDGKLIFSRQLLSLCKDGSAGVTIVNANQPTREIASCRLVYLPDDAIHELEDLAENIRSDYPPADAKTMVANLEAYIRINFGTVFHPQLVEWLKGKTKM